MDYEECKTQSLFSMILEFQKEIENVITQYESRIARLVWLSFYWKQEQFDSTEKKLNNEHSLKTKLDTKVQDYEQLLSDLIEESEDIRETTLLYMNEECDENTKEDCVNKIKVLLMKFQDMDLSSDYIMVSRLKEHFLILHQTLFDLLKQLKNATSDLNSQEVRYQGLI